MEIDRHGPVGGNMVFEPGTTWRTEYGTPFGRLPLDIVTESVEVMPDDGAGNWQNVKIKYTLRNQGEALGEYELYIERI